MKHKQLRSPTAFTDWIRKHGVNALARELKVDPSAVSRWAKGTAQPSLEHAIEIISMSGGALHADDLTKGRPQ